MATKQSTADFILDQLKSLGAVRVHKMFGEYALYCDEKVVGLICDDTLYMKITEPGKALLGDNYREGQAYPGSKPFMEIDADLLDDREWLCKLVRVTADALLVPKQRAKSKKQKVKSREAAINNSAHMSSPATIPAYVAAVPNPKAKAVCRALKKLLDEALPKSKIESKIWHRTPVWFDDGNPLAGFAALKNGTVKLMFWSGQDFKVPGLFSEGGFKMASAVFTEAGEIKPALVKRWCKESRRVQWDYKNIVKRKGKLVKLGKW